MDKTILIVTAMDGAENLARTISRDADAIVEIARSRRAALARLRRGPVTALLLDASLSEAEMTTSDVLWQNAHGAVPLEIPLASLGASSVVRLLRSLLEGRKQAETQGRRCHRCCGRTAVHAHQSSVGKRSAVARQGADAQSGGKSARCPRTGR